MGDDELAGIRNAEIGFIFQNFQLLPRETALANVELPLVYRGVHAKERRARAIEALQKVKLERACTTSPPSCPAASGSAWPSPGRWRARRRSSWPTSPPATSTRPPARRSSSSSRSSTSAGHTIVLVTHEPRLAARCPRAIRLRDGKVVGDGPGAEVAFGDPPVAAAGAGA